jgi:hypothetical protein
MSRSIGDVVRRGKGEFDDKQQEMPFFTPGARITAPS